MNHSLPDLPLLLADVPDTLRQALSQEGVPWDDRRSGRAGRFVLFDSRRSSVVLGSDQVAIDIHALRLGRLHDPFAALADERAAFQQWQIGGLPVRETVAGVDRAVLRQRLLADLRVLVEAAGGLWLRVSPFPHPYRTAFNFRLDHDEYEAHDFAAALDAMAGYEQAVSHYICASTHANRPEAMARLRGAHVGSHGWWHHTYREATDNVTNIRRGIEGLRAAGIDPVGFVAPHGRFHRGLLKALSELGITHSSEFGLAYDDLPFFPSRSDVLQIPIHPICLGVCLEAAGRVAGHAMTASQAAEATLEHWQSVAADKHRAGDPIFFYGHPDGRVGRFPQILRGLLACVSQLPAVWLTTLAEFERWWRRRLDVRLSATRRQGVIEVLADELPPGHRIALECFRGNEVASLGLDRPSLSFSPDALSWRRRCRRQPGYAPPEPIAPTWRANLRWRLDWERVTPLDEINIQTWRGWAKRTLRRMGA
jgi:hypothetical protein